MLSKARGSADFELPNAVVAVEAVSTRSEAQGPTDPCAKYTVSDQGFSAESSHEPFRSSREPVVIAGFAVDRPVRACAPHVGRCSRSATQHHREPTRLDLNWN